MNTPIPIAPMKAILHDTPFTDENWVFERKLDGIRCIAIKTADAESTLLLSRNNLPLNGRFPEIAQALDADATARDVVLDGEVVAFAGRQTSFARLAQRGSHPAPVYYYVFDLLYHDGEDLRDRPLRERKRILRDAITFEDPLRISRHRNREGEKLYAAACRKGWEGLIAKRADSPYSGARSKDWLKLKCGASQELVVGGYTAPRGTREVLGALLLGYYDANDDLRYAGRVGTGFSRETLHDLAARLEPLRRTHSPFADEIPERDTTWVRPHLVAQVAFTEWTRDGRLRHPRFLGLREDKAAREVVRE